MFEQIDMAAAVLADPQATWVDRRDAADDLGAIVCRAVDVLAKYSGESDVDVHSAVERALGQVESALTGARIDRQARAYSMEDFSKACDKPGKRSVEMWQEGFVVESTEESGRRQRVYVTRFEPEDKVGRIRVFTYCGKPTPKALRWALQANLRINHGAVALTEEEGEERFMLVNCYLADGVTPLEIKTCVKELAFYGDWIEERLSGMDRD